MPLDPMHRRVRRVQVGVFSPADWCGRVGRAMPFLISIPLFALACAAALRGLVALLNRERGIYDLTQTYRPVSGQPEGAGEMKTVGQPQGE